MKKIIIMFLCLILLISTVVVSYAEGDNVVQPNYYWDFVESFPEAWNEDPFKIGGEFSYSSDGHIIFDALDGDDPSGHLQLFMCTANNGGTSMLDNDVIVARFKIKNVVFSKNYGPNVGYIGYDHDEAYIKPSYLYTNDWQVMYFDFQSDFYSHDIWYFVWFWYNAALFPMEMELDYIATFANMDDAKAYVASRGHDVGPEIIIDETESGGESETIPQTEEGSQPAVTPHTVAKQTVSLTSEPTATEGVSETDMGNVWIIAVIAAVIIIAAIVIIIFKKRK